MILHHMISTVIKPEEYLFTHQALAPLLEDIVRITEMLSEIIKTRERLDLKAERAVNEGVIIVPRFLHVINHCCFIR